VRCVPRFQLPAAGAPPCGRKKRGIDDIEDSDEHHQFMISPSETFKYKSKPNYKIILVFFLNDFVLFKF
jgi:hypothetical protein